MAKKHAKPSKVADLKKAKGPPAPPPDVFVISDRNDAKAILDVAQKLDGVLAEVVQPLQSEQADRVGCAIVRQFQQQQKPLNVPPFRVVSVQVGQNGAAVVRIARLQQRAPAPPAPAPSALPQKTGKKKP